MSEIQETRELSKICPKTGGGFGQLGDSAKLREALEHCRNCAQMIPQLVQGSRPERPSLDSVARYANAIVEEAKAALAEPVRNCDVGTAEEQMKRFNEFCYAHLTPEKGCGECPLNGEPCCELAWAQMLYKEEMREMKDLDLLAVYAVCDDCARSLGFVRKDKAVGVWMDECGVCHQRKPCTALHHDWKPIKKGETE